MKCKSGSIVLVILVLAIAGAAPANSFSIWFSSKFQDLTMALKRFSDCIPGLAPLELPVDSPNGTVFLIKEMTSFLEQADYNDEQLKNITGLMDLICRPGEFAEYPISLVMNITRYDSKANRCESIDEAMSSMYPVMRRASFNKIESLDFSSIKFYPNASLPSAYYNITDLINTSWIKSDYILENVCHITDSIKEYVKEVITNRNVQFQDRSSSTSSNGTIDQGNSSIRVVSFSKPQLPLAKSPSSLVHLYSLLDRILGIRRQLYWQSSNYLESYFVSLRSGFEKGRKSGVPKPNQASLPGSLENTATNESSSLDYQQPRTTTSAPLQTLMLPPRTNTNQINETI